MYEPYLSEYMLLAEDLKKRAPLRFPKHYRGRTDSKDSAKKNKAKRKAQNKARNRNH